MRKPRGCKTSNIFSPSKVSSSTQWVSSGTWKVYSCCEGFTCVTFTTGALAYFAPVYFETGIESLGEGCDGYNPDIQPFDKGSVNFVIGAITAGAGGHSFLDFEAQLLTPLITIKVLVGF